MLAMLDHEEISTLAGEPNGVREHLTRQVTTERILTAMIWGLGVPLVLGWLLLLFTVVDIWTAGHALGSVKTTWITHS